MYIGPDNTSNTCSTNLSLRTHTIMIMSPFFRLLSSDHSREERLRRIEKVRVQRMYVLLRKVIDEITLKNEKVTNTAEKQEELFSRKSVRDR